MQDFRKLEVWQFAHALTVDVYGMTKHFPRRETFGLSSQMQRSSASIGTNLAEGCGRGGDVDFARFVQMAMGSACELEYQIELSSSLSYIEHDAYTKATGDVQRVKRMLSGLLTKLRSKSHKPIAES
jgi:four helix bundle protein